MKNAALKLSAALLLAAAVLPAAHADAGTGSLMGKFENMFSGGLSQQDQDALRGARKQDLKDWVQDKKQNVKERVAQFKDQRAQAAAVVAEAKKKRGAFRTDFEQRIKEARTLTGATRQQALAEIAKDKSDLEKAIADAKAQVKAAGAAKRAAISQADADRTKARIQKEISAVERATPAAQLKALTAMRRNINVLLLAQKAVGANAKVAVLETMLTEVQARIDLLEPAK